MKARPEGDPTEGVQSVRWTLFSSVGGSIAFYHQEEFTPLTDIPRRGIFFLPQIVAIATKL